MLVMRKALIPVSLVTLLLAALALSAVSVDAAVSSDPFTRSQSTAVKEGMNGALLDTLLRHIEAQNARTDSADRIDAVLVIRHGNVVLEQYPDFLRPATLVRPLGTATQSVVSLLVGIAIDQDLVKGTNDPLGLYFPTAGASQAITIEHALTMTAGLAWSEAQTFAADSDVPALASSPDPVAFVLGRPSVAAPGERFLASSGLAHVLSALLAEVTGAPAGLFAREFLFDPLAIGASPWLEDSVGNTRGWSGLSLTPRDLAKVGVLCLGRGVWSGREIVSPEWIAAATSPHVAVPTAAQPTRGLGYLWWTDAGADLYYAEDLASIGLYLCPALDLVVVLAGTTADGDVVLFNLVRDYILPAAVAETLALR